MTTTGTPVAQQNDAGKFWHEHGLKVAVALLFVAFLLYAYGVQRLQHDQKLEREQDRMQTRAILADKLNKIEADTKAIRARLEKK